MTSTSVASRLAAIMRANLRAAVGERMRQVVPDRVAAWSRRLRPTLRARRRPAADRTERGPGPARPHGPPPPRRDPVMARYYANLEVPYGSDLATVQAAWKRLLRQYHPDLHAADPERQRLGTELVKQLNDAYAELRRRLEKNPHA